MGTIKGLDINLVNCLILLFPDGPEFDDDIEPLTQVAALEGTPLTLLCGRSLNSNPEAMVEWIDPDGNVVDSGASNLTNGDSELVLTFTSTRNDAGNWSCIVSVTGSNGELPLSPIVHPFTVTVVGECI